MMQGLTAFSRLLSTVAALVVPLALSRAASAETVAATLRFIDGDGIPAPIVFAKVEVWRLDWPVWGFQRTVTTDANGRFSTVMPFVGSRTYALRVFATNPAAEVFTQDIYTQPFYREPGRPGTEVLLTANTAFDVLDFSFTFPDDWARTHFNVADAILRGKAYADQGRDPRETDVIPRLTVLMNSVSTFYDPISHAMRMDPGFALDDFTVLHEYAHFLEEQISSFYGIASWHDGCVARIGEFGVHVEEPGIAWMEGFASYFAQAVGRAFGSEVDGPMRGTLSPGRLESPSCPPSSIPLISTEVFVAGALFDIMDTTNEPGDQLCSVTTSVDLETMIFQIFDRELDIGWTNPNIQLFATAWAARGLDLPPLLSTFGTSGLGVASPTPQLNYDGAPAANLAVWRPSAGATWFVLGGAAPTSWGTWGDRPVPRDYDGDGQTDVAVWRPSTGRWFVITSAGGGAVQDVQWGTPGDVPLPGDYDGDREVDFAVYRPSDGNVYIHNDSCGSARTISSGSGTPVAGDFDGDGVDEPGTYDAATGWFLIRRAGLGLLSFRIGTGGGTPVIADYDGDGRDDVALFRPDSGNWDVRSSRTGGVTTSWWGEPGDLPVPADYDGDGRADIATWNEWTGLWWIAEADGPQWSVTWGIAGDVPVPAP